MNFDKLIEKILKENEEQVVKAPKGALLTIRLPFEVKEDLERVAAERKTKMTPVVEGYIVAAKAMDKLKVKFPKLYDAILNAGSPEAIEQILQSLVSRELPLESVVNENFLQRLKEKLSDAATSAKSVLLSLSKFLGGLIGVVQSSRISFEVAEDLVEEVRDIGEGSLSSQVGGDGSQHGSTEWVFIDLKD